MALIEGRGIRRLLIAAALTLLTPAVVSPPALAAPVSYRVNAIRDVSRCGGQNAEVEAASDPVGGYVYEEWIGCNAIGFARSTDGGAHFSHPITLPGAGPLAWDPALTVAPNGTLYAAFMVVKGTTSVPVVVASFDHGRTFPQKTVLPSPKPNNWGDRDFIAAGAAGTVYLTWDYGPSGSSIKLHCFPVGSCAITGGEANIVMQVSTDGGRSFGPMVHVSPGFPAGGATSGSVLVEPSGKVDVLYERSRVAHRRGAYVFKQGHVYFTSSVDGGHDWSRRIKVGGSGGSISPDEWWIDGAIGSDAAGNLYATWDTQRRHGDVGWLSYSTDHGVTWSRPIRVTRDGAKVPHIVQSAGGPPGIVYVGWLAVSRPRGYAAYLRTFSIAHGWLSTPHRISKRFGNGFIWPGDTIGITTTSPNQLVLSWGSGFPSTGGNSEIFAAPVTVSLPPGA